ncbi:hypothetical protein ACCO45_008798 [Purpureocillium lilacinum]|uniref:Uncharacterized protein n=1 Tax=Purpureocillium lilacinum TaxID=33203 RepID=A0ACC4DJB7_PURLI
MSLKQEIETWVAALGRYDNNEFDDALGEFDKISDTSKILFNMGVIHATLGEHEKAVSGSFNFLLGDFEEALANFNDTLLYLRGNTMIDYAQLGLLFKLYSCEVLFNRGLCYIYLQQRDVGMQDLSYAVKEKVVEDHDVIDEAIREEAEGYTVFSIPVGVVYRPNEAKVRNLKTKDYLGKARLVAASDRSNAFTGFAGSEIKNKLTYISQAGKSEVKDDRPADNISFAATNLVKPGIQSRRQQSEPPTNRNVFPPTPPPENDRPSRGASVRNGPKPMPAKLSIPSQESGRRYEKAPSPEDGRARPGRSASAAPGRGYSQRDPVQAPAPLQRSSPLARRPTRTIDEEEAYPGELYDMYQTEEAEGRIGDNSSGTLKREDEGSDYDDGSLDEPEFEMISSNRRVPGSSSGSRAASRRPEIRKVRVKAHSDDVRYIMIGTAIEFPDLVDRVRDKFGLRRRFKIKIKDEDMPEGDMITMGDQDDLEMAVQSAISAAKRQRLDVAKMEIWIFEV